MLIQIRRDHYMEISRLQKTKEHVGQQFDAL